MKLLRTFATAAVVAGLTACAQMGERDMPSVDRMLSENTGQNGRACVRLSDIQSYGVLEDNLVSINGRRDYYLATVLPGCVDLQTSMRALFSGDFGEVCGQTMDRVVTQDDQCTINHIYQFDNRDEAFAAYHEVLERRKEMTETDEYPVSDDDY